MKKQPRSLFLCLSLTLLFPAPGFCQAGAHTNNLKVVIIRHGEKPAQGDNLTCRGLNRALQLPHVLYKKFGIPSATYVPALLDSAATKHARMFQTVSPFAIRYNLTINSQFQGGDFVALAASLKRQTGTVLLVWDHKAIAGIAHQLGIKGALVWPDDDYDSIWIISFTKGGPRLEKDKEALNPGPDCP